MYELAVGLRENPDNDVRLFLDSRTIPGCLSGEGLLQDPTFAQCEPWITYREIIRPKKAKITELLSEFDVALVTDLGPVFAASSGTRFIFIPGGSDLTQWSFPIRSRSTRPRSLRRNILELIIGARLRPAIRSSVSVWAWGPFSPILLAAKRLGLSLDTFLPQMVDTDLFFPAENPLEELAERETITVFHPTRILFESDPRMIEAGGCLGNDVLIKGFARAASQGLDVRLVLIDREGSPDQQIAKELIEGLGISNRVVWLSAGTSAGFTWREMADLYRECDIAVSTFSGWTGLITLEAAASGKPVITRVEEDAMAWLYPEGHPLVQAGNEREVCDAILWLANSEVRRSVGESSRQWVLNHHDRGLVARRCALMLAGLGFV